ncbi:AraC family transcriptional regulator [Pararobbsia silviterrae]|uniref:AraC family transcriptional regulator n=1 Tax=Pararobbsia silviterrae TaxID=1792498 RepID=A0A494XBX9_9BURK|nr:AraC family transcriptional regulator [Pararobbsia silviterrae]RKP47141.1 AraC family transcriptional regulator [Pararobbsia silviterrae]
MDDWVRASGIRGYAALMRSLGHSPTAQLRRYGIDENALGRDDAMVSLRAVMHLLEASAAQTACDDFGLRLSRYHDIDVLGPLSIALQNAPTVRDAMAFAAQHACVQSPCLAYAVHASSEIVKDAVEVSIEIGLAHRPAQRQTIDLCLADSHTFTRLLADDRYRLLGVSLPHTPLAAVSTYERFFGARVWVDQPRASLHLARSTLSADLRSVNATLRRIAEDYIARHFERGEASVADRVRQVLRQTLGLSEHSKQRVADGLAMHPRTMQRRLAAESTDFETVRDELRKELALHYLCETTLPLAQVAMRLGFPAQSALSRACRQWYGVTPMALRRQAITRP